MKKSKEPTILVYDVETTPLKSWHFALGKQVLRHNSLDPCYSMYEIICLSYMYDTDKKATILDWGEKGEDSSKIIHEFDKIIKDAQDRQILIIGKNNKRFDDKHINTQQWLIGADPMPNWAADTDDLESQFRKYFYFPSYSLDAISKLKGLGGKTKMEFQDWIDCVQYKQVQRCITEVTSDVVMLNKICLFFLKRPLSEVLKEGKLAFNKMRKYNGKDSEDTMKLLLSIIPYCKFKSRIMPRFEGELRCQQQNCGSRDIIRNGTRVERGIRKQKFYCKEHGGYAGKATILKDGTFGKMGQ